MLTTAVQTGSADIPPSRMRTLSNGGNADVCALTHRQREILQGIIDGLSNKEIGRRLGISHFTVRNHVSRLLQELGFSDRIALKRAQGDREPTCDDAQSFEHRRSDRSAKGVASTTVHMPADAAKDAVLRAAIEAAIAQGAKIGITLNVGHVIVSGFLVDAYITEYNPRDRNLPCETGAPLNCAVIRAECSDGGR